MLLREDQILGLQRARDAAFNLGAFERGLAQADVIKGLDPGTPGMDLGSVDVARGRRVAEEQCQGQALVDMLGGGGVGVDDLLVADLVRVLEELKVVVGHVRGRVVDAAELAFFADLDLRCDRMDRRGRIVYVRDRSGRRDGLQVRVVDAVLPHGFPQLRPVATGGDRDTCLCEKDANAVGGRLPVTLGVLVEVRAIGVGGGLESGERRSSFYGEPVRGTQGVVGDSEEVDVGEVDTFLTAVADALRCSMRSATVA